jgi:polysaccharide biosynthesis protein PslJ
MCWCLAMRLHPKSGLDRNCQPIRVAGALFMCSVLASYVSANRHWLDTTALNAADRGIISTAGWLTVLVLAADGICDRERLTALLRRVVLGVTAMAVLAIGEFFTGINASNYIVVPGLSSQPIPTDLQIRGGLYRPSATAAHPLELAAVLAMGLPIAIHQARFAPPALRLRSWLKVALIAGALPVTISRTAVFELVALGIILLPTWSRRERRYVCGIALVSVTAMFVLVPKLLSAFLTILEQLYTGSASTASRVSAISGALQLVPQHPWLGVGFGTFSPLVYFYTDDEYVSTAIQMGLVGLAALIALFVAGWLMARSLRRQSEDPEVRDFAQCLAAAVAAAAVSFGTFDALGFKMAAGLTFLLLGCVGAAWRLLRDSPNDVLDSESGSL